jgi:hypothetical protein
MLMLVGIAGILLVALALLVFSLVSLALALALILAQVLLLSFRKTRAVGAIVCVCSATGAVICIVIWYIALGFVTNFGAPVSSVDIAAAAVVGFAWLGSAAAISCGLIAAVIALLRFVWRSHFAGQLRLSGPTAARN